MRAVGEVAEWSIVPDSKSGDGKPSVGSNPTLSATNAKKRHDSKAFFLFVSYCNSQTNYQKRNACARVSRLRARAVMVLGAGDYAWYRVPEHIV
jgi:hypothetical protein